MNTQEFLLSLPGDKDVVTMQEERLSSDSTLLRKVIKYRNGIEVMLVEDFQGTVYSVSIKAKERSFRFQQGAIQLV